MRTLFYPIAASKPNSFCVRPKSQIGNPIKSETSESPLSEIFSDGTDPCPECNWTNFSAIILYSNSGTTPSTDLRIRLVGPSASFLDVDGPPLLPKSTTPAAASVGPVHALAVGTSDEIAVSGIIDAPMFVLSNSGITEGEFINFHVYAVLDELIDGQWIPVDSGSSKFMISKPRDFALQQRAEPPSKAWND
jgi:hypothetical protein